MLNNKKGQTGGASVDLQDVGVSLGGRFIIRNVYLKIEQGEFVSLLGASGIGKTTLIRAIAGILPIQEGLIKIGGKIVTEPSGRVPVIFQDGAFFPWLSVLDNILFPIRSNEELNKQEHLHKIESLITELGLDDSKHLYPAQISGGMLQRLSIIRAIAANPHLLIMDEPFSALDPLTRQDVIGVIIKLQRDLNFTGLVVTHSVEDAYLLSHRILILSGPEPTINELTIDSGTHFEDLKKQVMKHLKK